MIRNTLLKGLGLGCAVAATLAWPVRADMEKTLRFIPETVDFGVIREEDGSVRRQVKAVNISSDSTFIISARTSCGCSAAEYSEAAIAPGDTTIVTVSYDPTNRPGKFLKTARFFTGEERIGNSLKMSGMVIPSRRNLNKAYPEKAGVLRLSTPMVTVGEITRKEARPLFVGFYNDSDKPLPLTVETDATPLEGAFAPDTIEPYGIATLSLMIKGRDIPAGEKEIAYKATVKNASTGATIVVVPVVGAVKESK